MDVVIHLEIQVESRREIKSLKQQLKTSEYISCQEHNIIIESKSSVDESIIIIGGYNGLSYVSALECYCPSHDLLETLCPMSSMRSCTSTVKLNGEVYVIGGLHDNLWYGTGISCDLHSFFLFTSCFSFFTNFFVTFFFFGFSLISFFKR